MVWLIQHRDGTLDRGEVSVNQNNFKQKSESIEEGSAGTQNKEHTKVTIEEQELDKEASTADESNPDQNVMENVIENLTPNIGHYGDEKMVERKPADTRLLVCNILLIANTVAKLVWFTERGLTTKGWYFYFMVIGVILLFTGTVLFTYGTYKLGLWYCCGQKRVKDENPILFLSLACFLMIGFFFTHLLATIITSLIHWSFGNFSFTEFMANLLWIIGNGCLFLFYIPNTLMVMKGYPNESLDEWKNSLKLLWEDMLKLFGMWWKGTYSAPGKVVEGTKKAYEGTTEIKDKIKDTIEK